MFGRNGRTRTAVVDRATSVKDAVADATEAIVDYVDLLAKDTMFRQRLEAVIVAGAAARRRLRRQAGLTGLAGRLLKDEAPRAQLLELATQLQATQTRIKKARSHKRRNTVLFVGGAAMPDAAAPVWREKLSGARRRRRDNWAPSDWAESRNAGTGGNRGGDRGRSTRLDRYNQWTQFEEFRGSWRASRKFASSTTRFSIGRRQSAGSVPNGTRRSSSSSRTAASHGSRRMERPRGASSASKRSEPVAAGSGCGLATCPRA